MKPLDQNFLKPFLILTPFHSVPRSSRTLETRRFLSPSHEGFSFIGKISFAFEIQCNPIKIVDFVNMGSQVVKIIFFSVNPVVA